MKKSEVDKFVGKPMLEIVFKDGTIIFTGNYPLRTGGQYYFATVNGDSSAVLAREIKTMRDLGLGINKVPTRPTFRLCNSCRGSGGCNTCTCEK